MSSFALRAFGFAGVSFMISACAASVGPARGSGEVGKLAPALSIQALDGKMVTPASGRVTVVEFWATWFTPCSKSLSQLEELKKRSGGNVDVIGIALNDTTGGVSDFAKARGVSFPIAWDEHQTLKRRWKVTTPGTMYILDGKGTVRFVHEADKNKDDGDVIAREVAELVSEISSNVEPGAERVANAPATTPATAVASATVPTAVPVAAAHAPSAEETSAPPVSEPAKAPKPRAKASGKKPGVTKQKK